MASAVAGGERLKTTGAVARELGLAPWQLLRLLSLKRVPEPGRCGSLRAWSQADVERAREALRRERGEQR